MFSFSWDISLGFQFRFRFRFGFVFALRFGVRFRVRFMVRFWFSVTGKSVRSRCALCGQIISSNLKKRKFFW